MINNNMEMIKRLKNIPDYNEYVALCDKTGMPSNSLDKYCLGVGMLSVALFKYPDLEWQEAYTKIVEDMNSPEELTKRGENGCCLVENKEKDGKPLGLIATGKGLLSSTKEHVVNGFKYVSDEEYERRLNICKECEWVRANNKCGQCHCYMGVKAKWDIKNICKLNKW